MDFIGSRIKVTVAFLFTVTRCSAVTVGIVSLIVPVGLTVTVSSTMKMGHTVVLTVDGVLTVPILRECHSVTDLSHTVNFEWIFKVDNFFCTRTL